MGSIYCIWVLIIPVLGNTCLKDIKQGDLITGSTFRTIKKSRLYSCAAECTAYTICKSFSFDKQSLTCHLNFDNGVLYMNILHRNISVFGSNITSWKEVPLGPCQKEPCGPSQYCSVRREGRRYCDQFINAARGKPAIASSVYLYEPNVAVDGSKATMWSSRSCFAVNDGDMNPWWQVDLEDLYLVIEITISSRGDCCPERLHDFAVEVYKEDPVSHPAAADLQLCYMYNGTVTQRGVTVNIPCTTPVTGRYLRISGKNTRDTQDLLQFCETEVFVLTPYQNEHLNWRPTCF